MSYVYGSPCRPSIAGVRLSSSRTAILFIQCVLAYLAAASACPAAVRVEAFRGEPFGIGRVTIDLQQGASTAPASDDRFVVAEANGRVLYPVMENKSSRRLLRSFLGIETPL